MMLARNEHARSATPRWRSTVRWLSIATAVVAAGALGVVGYRMVEELADSDDEVVEDEDAVAATATAALGDLATTHESTSGSIEYSPPVAIATPVAGTVLDLVHAGDTLSSGDIIATVDDRAVVWFDGATPAWRDLDVGDEGIDVLQLETALAALGFDPDGDVTIDSEYTYATADMVERWQEALGVEPTGDVALGDVVFGAGRIRVAAVQVDVGDAIDAGAPLISLGTAQRSGVFSVVPSDATSLDIGDEVQVTLPDRSSIAGRVVTIDEGLTEWTVRVEFADDAVLPTTDVVSATMAWDTVLVADAVSVPSSAILRLDSGGYVVDVIGRDGAALRTAVSIGTTVGTRTQITAGLSPGDEIIVL